MPPPRPFKRRRLADSVHILSKPFKSPLKIPVQPNSNNEPPTLPAHACLSKPSLPQATSKHRSSFPSKPSPQLAQLRKRQTALLSEISAVQASIETHAQALKLETSNTDQELEALIVKWTEASRAAAEEVFATAQRRVERMGGVKGWKEREREKKRGGGWGWDEEGKEKDGEEREGKESAGYDEGEGEGEPAAEVDGSMEDEVRNPPFVL